MGPVSTMFVPNTVNEFVSPLYDTLTAAAAATLSNTIIMFQTPQSQSIGPELTNMTGQGVLSAGESQDVYSIRCQFLGTHPTDMLAIMKSYQISLVYGGKRVFESTIDATPGGGGVTGFGALSTTAATTTLREVYANNGVADPRAVYTFDLNKPIKLESGPQFSVVLKCGGTAPTLLAAGGTTYGGGLFMRVYLDGIRRTLA